MGDSPIQSHVRPARLRAGLSQAALASAANLSRQTVNAIENGRLVPSTDVALRLARALASTVEDLFGLAETGDTSEVRMATPAEPGARLAVAAVGPTLVAHALNAEQASPEGLRAAEGYATGPRMASLSASRADLARNVFIAGCDPSLSILAEMVGAHGGGVIWLHASSGEALEMLKAGTVHIAGTHLPEAEANVTSARDALGAAGGMLVGYASWEQGMVVARGNPTNVRSVTDFARRDVRIVNRDAGSGARRLLDSLLESEGVAASSVRGYESEVRSHVAVARAVANVGADAGIALNAVASAFDLDFVPLAPVRFDFVVPAAHLSHPTVREILSVMSSRAFRRELQSLPGYETSQTGTTVHELSAA